MRPYMTFTDDGILERATPQQELPEGWTRESIPAPIPEELMDIKTGESGVLPISQEDEEGEEMAPANKSLTPILEELTGRLASELDAAGEPTDEPTVLMATVRKPAREPVTPLCRRRWGKRRRFQVATSPAGQR